MLKIYVGGCRWCWRSERAAAVGAAGAAAATAAVAEAAEAVERAITEGFFDCKIFFLLDLLCF